MDIVFNILMTDAREIHPSDQVNPLQKTIDFPPVRMKRIGTMPVGQQK
jgi:hypothetical protein